MKVEDSNDPTHTCETETQTTVAEDWEILEFDFANQAPDTESLSIGLERGWIYNMASIFFNFGTEGAIAGEKIYYFDEVKFDTSSIGSPDENEMLLSVPSSSIMIYPNPAEDRIHISMSGFKEAIIYTLSGKKVLRSKENDIDISTVNQGIYIIELWNKNGEKVRVKLLKN